MGKGSKPRPVSKNYGAEIERIFGKRCLRHRRAECPECFRRDYDRANDGSPGCVIVSRRDD